MTQTEEEKQERTFCPLAQGSGSGCCHQHEKINIEMSLAQSLVGFPGGIEAAKEIRERKDGDAHGARHEVQPGEKKAGTQ